MVRVLAKAHREKKHHSQTVFGENLIGVLLSKECSECRKTAKDSAVPQGRLAGALSPLSG